MTAQVNLVLVWNYLRLHYSLRMWFYIPSCLLCRHGPFPLGTFSNWRFIDKWPQRHLFQKNEEGRGAVSQRFYFWRASWNEVSFWERFSLHMWGHKHCLPNRITASLPAGCSSPCTGSTSPSYSTRISEGWDSPKSWAPQHAAAVLCGFLWWTGMKLGTEVIRTPEEGQVWG